MIMSFENHLRAERIKLGDIDIAAEDLQSKKINPTFGKAGMIEDDMLRWLARKNMEIVISTGLLVEGSKISRDLRDRVGITIKGVKS